MARCTNEMIKDLNSSKMRGINVLHAAPEDDDLLHFRDPSRSARSSFEESEKRRNNLIAKASCNSLNSKSVEKGLLHRIKIPQKTHGSGSSAALKASKTTEIILVHGLEGDPFIKETPNRVWMKPGSSVVWVRDLLPRKLEGMSLHVYRYDTNIVKNSFGKKLNELTSEHALRLLQSIFETLKSNNNDIILMGNGYGGLIAKKALVLADQMAADSDSTANLTPDDSSKICPDVPEEIQSQYSTYARNFITGVIFLGTPHNGWTNRSGCTYYTQATPPESLTLQPPPKIIVSEHNQNETPPVLQEETDPVVQEDRYYNELENTTLKLQELKRRGMWEQSLREGYESTYLETLSRDFLHICDHFNVLSVYGSKLSKMTLTKVGNENAVLDADNEVVLDLDVTHENLVRFDNRSGPYEELETAICKMVLREDNSQHNSHLMGEPERSTSRLITPIIADNSRKSTEKERGGLLDVYSPSARNIPAHTLEVTLKMSEQLGHFHDLKLEHYTLQNLAKGRTQCLKDEENTECSDDSECSTEPSPVTLVGGYLWVHVPGNDRSWAHNVITRIHNDRSERPLKILSEEYWRDMEQHNNYTTGLRHVYMRPSCSVYTFADIMQLVLFMPYLHWSECPSLNTTAAAQTQSHPVPEMRPSFARSRHHHPRRTLDQFFYRSTDTRIRDADQIISYKTRSPGKTGCPGLMLMVDQLWVCVTEQDTIFTFFPKNEVTHGTSKSGHKTFADVCDFLIDELKESRRKEDLFRDAYEMTAQCLYAAVTALLYPKYTHADAIDILNIFQDTIAETNEAAVKALNEFIRAKPVNHSDSSELAPESLNYLEIQNDLELLRKASDLEDELRILQRLFYEQRKVISSFMDRMYERKNSDRALRIAKDARDKLESFAEEVQNLQADAQTTKQSIVFILDLKQKKANLEEARETRKIGELGVRQRELAVKQQEQTAEQGKTLMIFTTITVIFLPLGFFVGLFGMNLREWSGEEKNPSAKSAAIFIGVISTVIIVLAMMLAFWVRIRKRVRSKNAKGKNHDQSGDEEDQINIELLDKES